jgi:Ser/Thr protein kinase RdoA (MazF antagonist)
VSAAAEGGEPATLLVHSMGTDLTEPDWTPLTDPEVRSVLAHYPGPANPAGETVITWRSPRPMSAAALARRGGQTWFVKRHDARVRTAGQLAAEHAFAGHLRARGVPVPEVLRTSRGQTMVSTGAGVYEVHRAIPGVDLYRDAMSWTPFTSLGHARAAGAALARLHDAAAGFAAPPRPPAVLTSSCEIITAADPVAAVGLLAGRRPGLARYLAGRRWQDDLTRHHLPVICRAAPLLATLAPQWAHGDWHPSNLTWTDASPSAEVAGVFDLGLANRTFAAHDLAIAVERSAVSWLGLAGTGQAEADLDAVDALLGGYQEARPLETAELTALAEVLPIVHLEYALSETEYFADVVHSPANASLAYDGYLIGHTRWFQTPAGSTLLDHLRRRAAHR